MANPFEMEFTEQEEKQSYLFPDGATVQFEIISSESKVWSTGKYNGMNYLDVNIKLKDDEGNVGFARDKFTFVESFGWKVIQFCKAVGETPCGQDANGRNKYRMPCDKIVGRFGTLKVKTREYTKDGETLKLNDVGSYIAKPVIDAEDEF